MSDPVDEQGGRAEHFARGLSAADVPQYSLHRAVAGTIALESLQVESELGGVAVQVGVLERFLPMEQHVVHLPEAALERRRLGRARRGQRVRVDLDQGEVAEREANRDAELPLDQLDLPVGPSRVGALVVAVLEDQPGTRRPPHVIDGFVERLEPATGVTHPGLGAHLYSVVGPRWRLHQGNELGDHATSLSSTTTVRSASMDPERARELLARERERIEGELATLQQEGPLESSDRVEPGDLDSEDLYQDELNEGLAEDLRAQLGAVERAEKRLADGTYGLSIESGKAIPDERLEALPTAERTIEEQERHGIDR